MRTREIPEVAHIPVQDTLEYVQCPQMPSPCKGHSSTLCALYSGG